MDFNLGSTDNLAAPVVSLEWILELLKKFEIYSRTELRNTTFSIDENFYWNISSESRYDLNVQPENIDVGSLHEEIESLRMIGEPSEGIALSQLEQIGSLLQFIAWKIKHSEKR